MPTTVASVTKHRLTTMVEAAAGHTVAAMQYVDWPIASVPPTGLNATRKQPRASPRHVPYERRNDASQQGRQT